MHQSRMFSIQLKYVFSKRSGMKLQLAVFDDLNRGLRKRLHLHEPLRLRTDDRLDRGMAAVAGTDIVRVVGSILTR